MLYVLIKGMQINGKISSTTKMRSVRKQIWISWHSVCLIFCRGSHENGITAQNKTHNDSSFHNYWTFKIKQNNLNTLKELTGMNITALYLKSIFVLFCTQHKSFCTSKMSDQHFPTPTP